MQIPVPKRLVTWLKAYSQDFDLTPEEAGRRLLDALEVRLSSSTGVRFMGPDWERVGVSHSLIASPTTHQTPPSTHQIPSGDISGSDPSEDRPPTADEILLLERSKIASGFAGVYRNNNGFRAVVRLKGDNRNQTLKTRSTAEHAAWDRYQFHLKNKLPYGEKEEAFEWLRSRMPTATDEEVRQELEEMEELRTKPLPFGAPIDND